AIKLLMQCSNDKIRLALREARSEPNARPNMAQVSVRVAQAKNAVQADLARVVPVSVGRSGIISSSPAVPPKYPSGVVVNPSRGIRTMKKMLNEGDFTACPIPASKTDTLGNSQTVGSVGSVVASRSLGARPPAPPASAVAHAAATAATAAEKEAERQRERERERAVGAGAEVKAESVPVEREGEREREAEAQGEGPMTVAYSSVTVVHQVPVSLALPVDAPNPLTPSMGSPAGTPSGSVPTSVVASAATSAVASVAGTPTAAGDRPPQWVIDLAKEKRQGEGEREGETVKTEAEAEAVVVSGEREREREADTEAETQTPGAVTPAQA
ncbi:hypothetical protein KIPB_006294, partial [Kipferlia bialata]